VLVSHGQRSLVKPSRNTTSLTCGRRDETTPSIDHRSFIFSPDALLQSSGNPTTSQSSSSFAKAVAEAASAPRRVGQAAVPASKTCRSGVVLWRTVSRRSVDGGGAILQICSAWLPGLGEASRHFGMQTSWILRRLWMAASWRPSRRGSRREEARWLPALGVWRDRGPAVGLGIILACATAKHPCKMALDSVMDRSLRS
jgi:hypothetical protein